MNMFYMFINLFNYNNNTTTQANNNTTTPPADQATWPAPPTDKEATRGLHGLRSEQKQARQHFYGDLHIISTIISKTP